MIKFIVTIGTNKYKKDNRYYAVSVKNKVEYLIEKLNEMDYRLEIVSCAPSKNTFGFLPRRKEDFNGNVLINTPTFCFPTRLGQKIQKLLIYIWLFFYLVFNTNRNEDIIVYHQYNPIIKLAQKIKKFNIILEVEEIYSDLTGNKTKRKKEMQYIKNASKYIVASEKINNLIGNLNKPYCIFNGRYDVFKKTNSAFNDGKIHIVYAGSIYYNLVAFTSVEIAKYLSDKYVIHIIGWGLDKDINLLKTRIAEINKTAKCRVEYNGMLSGNRLSEFLQSCHIGISPQRTDEEFANACFPSKLSLYLSNGLRVVASYSRAVEESILGSLIDFSPSSDPIEFAKEIQSLNLNDKYDSMKMIKNLDARFYDDLYNFMRE
ncbi:hypothetical protein LC085_09920 [Bacillus tianshenii]|uniref:hypothetical protein n=1 Tax=Sutcliffiella tianshenii TaxID=1463404 RepID=UPI001CD69941|nr:hypothetical protein [Bacillus tianshenii]MCA1320222.1 hypothetical protein [Bacillus tianshenii]